MSQGIYARTLEALIENRTRQTRKTVGLPNRVVNTRQEQVAIGFAG